MKTRGEMYVQFIYFCRYTFNFFMLINIINKSTMTKSKQIHKDSMELIRNGLK